MNPPASQEMTSTSGSSYSQNNIDDDIDELLRCFGPANSEEFAPNIDFSDVELDKNLSEILEDLQNVKTEGGENNNSLAGGCSSLPDDPFNSLWNVQRNIELEEQRLEKLRRPRFQTLPAYKKRAKQETQWLEAVHAAKIAVSPKTELEEYMGFDLSSDLPSVSDGGGGGKKVRHLVLLNYPGYFQSKSSPELRTRRRWRMSPPVLSWSPQKCPPVLT